MTSAAALSIRPDVDPAELFDAETGLPKSLFYVAGRAFEPEQSATFDMPLPFYEARLAASSRCFELNSILALPDLLTRRECALLVAAAERAVARAAAGSARKVAKRQAAAERGRSAASSVPSALHRLPVCDLGSDAVALSETLLKERILPFVEATLPMTSRAIFGREDGLAGSRFEFSAHEPAVNRYAPGGDFRKHTDKCALTVNVLLSEPKSFEGGGTLFWPQGLAEARADEQCTLATLVCPSQATALLFNGAVEHSGKAVEAGLRHIYVASFNLVDQKNNING